MKSGLLKNRIGIQIITRDRHSYLAVLLSSLLNQTQKNWDLFLVDNSTTPVNKDHLCNTLINRINNEGHRVLYNIVDPSIRDIGQLRNIALDMDDCEIGCRIDDDSYCEPDYLKRLYDVMEIFGSEVGAVGGQVPPMMNEKQWAPPTKEMNKIDKFLDLQGESDQCLFYNQDDLIEADHIRSSFMYWNELVKKVRHPECYGRTGYREETDLTYRLKQLGYKLYIVPQAICWHIMAPGGGGRDINYDPRYENIRMFKERMYEHKSEVEKGTMA